jgi:hypothetical protein
MKCSVFGFLVFFSCASHAQQAGIYKEWLTTSSNINWSSGMVTAEGFGVAPEGRREEVGRLLACRAAVTDAQRNLLEATKGVRVSVSTSVSKFAADYDIVKTAVEGVVRGASILERKMGEDSTCKVTMGLFVAGKISDSIYQNTAGGKSSASLFFKHFVDSIFSSAYAQDMSANFDQQTGSISPWSPDLERLNNRVSKLEGSFIPENPQMLLARQQAQPTGLIIDVRGHRFFPSIAPNLLHPQGKVIYPSQKDKKAIKTSGKLLSLFSRSIEFALNHPIVGDKPLLIKAAVSKESQTNIQLNSENASKLTMLAKYNFFDDPSVIIVLD